MAPGIDTACKPRGGNKKGSQNARCKQVFQDVVSAVLLWLHRFHRLGVMQCICCELSPKRSESNPMVTQDRCLHRVQINLYHTQHTVCYTNICFYLCMACTHFTAADYVAHCTTPPGASHVPPPQSSSATPHHLASELPLASSSAAAARC